MAGDSNCGIRAVSTLLGMGDDAHELVCHDLMEELVNHKGSYMRVFGDNTKFQSVNDSLVPLRDTYAPEEHWMRFPEMGHLIARAYDMACIDLKPFSRFAPPTNPIERIICVGWLAKSRHFVQAYLKLGCPIPPTSPEWDLYHIELADTWPDVFVDRMHEYERLKIIDKQANAKKSKLESPIDLAGDGSFHVFI
ncbi:uncharacterized protein LOC131648474 [Vicia villosa]|uniref:uncharacterized protein LOC131648474 n=1 Tax=Vicia villosa TaxID=3911 RepID=UPI00273BB539|nr:uncharacterized protein LOC131648474 [Vicia villosa]